MLKIFIFLCFFDVITGNVIREEISTIGVQNASISDSPWYAFLEIGNLRCGGSLVNDLFVVTAAHCFDSLNDDLSETNLKRNVKIKFGEWIVDKNPDCESEEGCESVAEIQPKSVKIHEDYKKSGENKHKYDIAVIKLAWKPRKSDYIQNIDLSEQECKVNLTSHLLTVYGFGQYRHGKYVNIKKKIQINIFSNFYCNNKYDKLYDKTKHICGNGYEGVTTCSGDSGSGLVRSENGITYLEGITVFGEATCGRRDMPSGFMKVACFEAWIKEQFNVLTQNS